jgi:hypothetical protein
MVAREQHLIALPPDNLIGSRSHGVVTAFFIPDRPPEGCAPEISPKESVW